MITYQLPRKMRFIPCSGIFTATFSAVTIGKYNFNGQQITLIPKLLQNTVYLIDSFSIGGNIAGEDFLTAIETIPLLNLRKTLNNENIFDVPTQIHNFSTDRQIVHFFKTGLDNCGLAASLTGILQQPGPLVGIVDLKISINYSLHAIDTSDFEKLYKQEI